MVLQEFHANARKAAKCGICTKPIAVGSPAYFRQVCRVVGGSLTKTSHPRWQAYHAGECAAVVGGVPGVSNVRAR